MSENKKVARDLEQRGDVASLKALYQGAAIGRPRAGRHAGSGEIQFRHQLRTRRAILQRADPHRRLPGGAAGLGRVLGA